MGRNDRAKQAAETLRVLEQGSYVNGNGAAVAIAETLRQSVAATRLIRPEEWPAICEQARQLSLLSREAKVYVTGETTLAAMERLVIKERRKGVLALNFASARNAGGGFLGGSQAQEESLARASGLYFTLLAGEVYYAANRACTSKLYTDHAILSPGVPVFRNDSGEFLESAYEVSFATMPAPNRGAIAPDSADASAIAEVFRRRIESVLALAAVTGHARLILGAWGCGVFRNDPKQVAELFAEALLGPQKWASRFEEVCFAVFDSSADRKVRRSFEEGLAIKERAL